MQMTGKDLIIYILQNNLENEPMLELMSEIELASKFDVGIATIKFWYEYGYITTGFKIGDTLYFLKDTPDPRKDVQ